LAQESQSVGRIVVESIREIKAEVASIKSGTEEQVTSSELINKSMQEISELCEESIKLAKNSNMRIRQVDEKSALLKSLVSGFKLKN
jgi:methyl-accepting chemotaxis protein